MLHSLQIDNVTALLENGGAVVRNVSFNLERAKIGCLLGASGCGKTSFLRCVAGLQGIDGGAIRLNGRVLNDKKTFVRPEQREVSMVFQDYALFPHFTVEENIAFGIRKLPSPERGRRVERMLKLVDLPAFRRRLPYELSGGQQQRVALARSLVTEPQLLLLDEPFSSLDAGLRPELASEVKDLVNRAGITTLMVTHDQNEALTMADMLGVMQDGELLQWDSAYNIYHRPVSRDIAAFIGIGNFIRGRIIAGNRVVSELGTFTADSHFQLDESVDILIRPDDIIHDDDSARQAIIVEKRFRGSDFLYLLKLANGEQIHCLAPSHHNHAVGGTIGIVVDVQHVIAFPSQTRDAMRA